MARKPKELLLILPDIKKKELDTDKKSARMYIDSMGKAWPWVCDQNPRMYLGWQDEEDED